MCVGLIGASMFSLFHYAEWKASVRSAFILQNENTEDAIGVLESRALRSAFSSDDDPKTGTQSGRCRD